MTSIELIALNREMHQIRIRASEIRGSLERERDESSTIQFAAIDALMSQLSCLDLEFGMINTRAHEAAKTVTFVYMLTY
jgi:hypothetical protein